MTRRKRKPVQKVKKEKNIQLRAGITYLIAEEKPIQAFTLFADLVADGIPGLCISRNFPTHIRQDFKINKSTIFWLSRRKGEMNIDPAQLPMISHTIQDFITKSKETITLLDGLEYLISQNDFKPVLRFIQHIRDEVLVQGTNLLIPFSPQTLSVSEVKILERELELLIINQQSV
ncbi:MAG: DUF835 domain-containing protein [Candidatus Hodarchaeales archaeon]|jgi:hypothetical protein